MGSSKRYVPGVLAVNVVVKRPEELEGRTLLAGSSPSEEDAGLITNEAAWEVLPSEIPQVPERSAFDRAQGGTTKTLLREIELDTTGALREALREALGVVL